MRFAILTAFLLSTLPAQAQISQMLADQGLAPTAAQLSAQANPSPDDLFALGAVRFLRGIEKTLQSRWQSNLTGGSVNIFINLPVLRLPVPQNPNPAPFQAAMITDLFADLQADLSASRQALQMIPENAEPALELNLLDIWFDINSNGSRDTGEGLTEFASNILGAGLALDSNEQMPTELQVRFDRADVAWLIAYNELLSGVSQLVLAFDPTQSITRVLEANEKMAELLGDRQPHSMADAQFGDAVDQFAMFYGALNQQPDPAHTRAAHAHFLNMIAANRKFWALLPLETDNDREWIPNPSQTAALGFEMPADTGPQWQAVLAEIEAVLNGDLLVSYWRISPVGGVNVEKLFNDPPVVDIVDWVQGYGLVPYLERGQVARGDSMMQFANMFGGNALLFALLLN